MENPIIVPFDLNTARKIKSGEIEGSVLIGNIKIEFVYESTQIIAIVHNPALIYKLSKLDCVNFIEMTEGYLNKTCTFVSN